MEKLGVMLRVNANSIEYTTKTVNRAVKMKIELRVKTITETI